MRCDMRRHCALNEGDGEGATSHRWAFRLKHFWECTCKKLLRVLEEEMRARMEVDFAAAVHF
jgi:hypothetical protein